MLPSSLFISHFLAFNITGFSSLPGLILDVTGDTRYIFGIMGAIHCLAGFAGFATFYLTYKKDKCTNFDAVDTKDNEIGDDSAVTAKA